MANDLGQLQRSTRDFARWQKALEMSPDNFSAHQELATLAEQRDELGLAAEHYEKAWRLRPEEKSLMLDLGRVWKQLNRAQEANAMLLAASRGAQPRVAEKARELLPVRYPYVYEFDRHLTITGRKELGDPVAIAEATEAVRRQGDR